MSNENEKTENESVTTESTETNTSSTSTNNNDSNESGNKKTVYIIEGIIAAAAVIFIVVALVMGGKNKNNPGPIAVSQDAVVSTNATGDITAMPSPDQLVEIDNSALLTDIPAIPSADEINQYTEEECEAECEKEAMVKLENADGSYVYVANFTDVDLLKKEITCTDEELQDFIYANLLVNFTTELTEERDVCQKYDSVTIDYAGYLDGVQFDNGTAEGQPAKLGAGTFIPGFEEGIIGMKVGETKDIKVTFPENYRATELAGKDVVFTITLQSIDGVPVELTDEFIAQNIPTLSSADEYIEKAKNAILSEKIYDYMFTKYYVSSISEEIALDYYNNTMNYYDVMSQSYQMSVEDMLTTTGEVSLADFKKEVMVSAAESSLLSTLFKAIGDYADLTVTEEDIITMRDEYGYTDTQTFFDSYSEQTVRDYLLTDKIIDYILESITEEETEE